MQIEQAAPALTKVAAGRSCAVRISRLPAATHFRSGCFAVRSTAVAPLYLCPNGISKLKKCAIVVTGMFNWICPQCGREVLASYSECPECAKTTAPPAPSPEPTAPPAPVYSQPGPTRTEAPRPPAPVAYAPAPAAPPQQPYYMQPPPPRSGMPTWLLTIVFSLAFVGLGAAVYWAIEHFREGGSPVAASEKTVAPPGKTGARANPYQKYVEVTGVRLFQDPKKHVAARFVVVNHSESEMADLAGTVDIRGRTAKEGEEPVGTFKFRIPSMGPNESREVTEPVETKLKVYELPDWQNIDARVHVTAP